MIGLDHFIPIYGSWKAYNDTLEAYERGDISALAGGAYLGSLSGAHAIHTIHSAQKTGNVSYFTVQAVSKLQMAPALGMASIPIMLAGANMELIESAPEEKQRGMWQMFSSALTGTFGIGSGLEL